MHCASTKKSLQRKETICEYNEYSLLLLKQQTADQFVFLKPLPFACVVHASLGGNAFLDKQIFYFYKIFLRGISRILTKTGSQKMSTWQFTHLVLILIAWRRYGNNIAVEISAVAQNKRVFFVF